jgi:hypothetical protein
MAQTDWALLEDSLDGTGWQGITVRRGPTHGISGPVGGGDFVFGFNSVQAVSGAVGAYCAIEGYCPIEPRPVHEPGSSGGGGGAISAAMKKGPSAGKTNYSSFIFVGAQTNAVTGEAYLLGLENASPHRIVLAKGQIQNGIPSVSNPGLTKILRYSQDTYDDNVWHQLRLDMVVNDNGDVLLWAYRNPIAETEGVGDVTDPQWEPVVFNDGLEFADGLFVDDVLAVNSESAPLLSGYLGFGVQMADTARRCYFDHIQVIRQMPPVV